MNFSKTPSRPSIGSPGVFRYEDKKSRLKRNSQLFNNSSLNDSVSEINKRIKIEYDEKINDYDFNLNFYSIPPFGNIDLDEAQKFVEERLKILHVFDEFKYDSNSANNLQDLLDKFKSLDLKDNFLLEVNGGKSNPKVFSARRRDHVSHFLLRLFCCQEEKLKKWFISRENDLLKYRLQTEKNNLDLVKFLSYNNLNFIEVDAAEKQILLKQKKINFNNPKILLSNVFFKIPFEEALDLLKTKRVYLQDGFCYCSASEMISIICSKFRLELSRSLAALYSYLPHLEENSRLIPIIQSFYSNIITTKKIVTSASNSNKESITIDMIDELSNESFPPCMQNIHELLRLNHHLKHYGRLHYSLFLKAVGLKLEDALDFFREEFIQKITPEKFQKEYAYNIRYSYGREGKKVNMSAFSCAKIINGSNPGPGDSHGCPFKHFDNNNLIKMLKKNKIDEENIDKIMQLIKQNQYTPACSSYFACKNNNVQPLQEIYHPNQYYNESRKILKSIPPNETQTLNNCILKVKILQAL